MEKGVREDVGLFDTRDEAIEHARDNVEHTEEFVRGNAFHCDYKLVNSVEEDPVIKVRGLERI